MRKYNSRYEYTISRAGESKDKENEWLDALEKNLTKEAVQPRRIDESMFDQINAIIGGKSKYKNVQDAVEDMQRRSGYFEYINKKTAAEESQSESEEPAIFKVDPNIKHTLENYLNSPAVSLSVPSIINYLKSKYKFDVSDDSLWDDPKLSKYIYKLQKSLEQRTTKETYQNLGKLDLNIGKEDIDPSNDDAWAGLLPATK